MRTPQANIKTAEADLRDQPVKDFFVWCLKPFAALLCLGIVLLMRFGGKEIRY